MYYKGKIGKTEIDFNTDYLFDKNRKKSLYKEQSKNYDSRVVNSSNMTRNQLFASKLSLSHPLFGGDITVGAEYSNTKRNDDYINVEEYVPTSLSMLKEQNMSVFLDYNRATPIGQVMAGVRYEHVDFKYYAGGMYIDGQSRRFGNLFPSISLSNKIGNVQMQLGYAVKTRRPTYGQLSNNVSYGNRFTQQTGNPLLEHETIHEASIMGVWKFLQFNVSYDDRRNAIIYWGEQLENTPEVTRLSFKNLKSLKYMSASVSAAPKFGVWSPQLTLAMRKQWLNLETSNGTLEMNKPIFMGTLNNDVDLGKGWIVSLYMYCQSKGDVENSSQTRVVSSTDVELSKSFFNDRLSVKLGGYDLFRGQKSGTNLYIDKMSTLQIAKYDSREVTLTIRYKFNTSRNKYKGTGAGQSEMKRL